MGEEMKQCFDRDRCDKFDRGRCERDMHEECECHDHDDDWNLWDWLPIIGLVFLLCGGTNIFNGNSSKSDCDDNGIFGSGWLLILILIFFVFGNQKSGKDGFLGGIFG